MHLDIILSNPYVQRLFAEGFMKPGSAQSRIENRLFDTPPSVHAKCLIIGRECFVRSSTESGIPRACEEGEVFI